MNKKQNAFWQKMEAMDLPADPLTEGEADRLRSRVLGAVKAAPAKRPRPRRLWWRAGRSFVFPPWICAFSISTRDPAS